MSGATLKEYTLEELKGLNTKKDLHLLIHGKVYAIKSFLDEHPGGDEVLLGEAGKDATEAFEDVGHSEEAREILAKFLVGTGPEGTSTGPSKEAYARAAGEAKSSGFSYLFPLAGLVAYFGYKYYAAQQA